MYRLGLAFRKWIDFKMETDPFWKVWVGGWVDGWVVDSIAALAHPSNSQSHLPISQPPTHPPTHSCRMGLGWCFLGRMCRAKENTKSWITSVIHVRTRRIGGL